MELAAARYFKSRVISKVDTQPYVTSSSRQGGSRIWRVFHIGPSRPANANY